MRHATEIPDHPMLNGNPKTYYQKYGALESRPKQKNIYVIEKDIPIPPVRKGDNSKKRLPWAEMEVGDSFFMGKCHIQTACKHVAARQKRCQHTYTARSYSGGARIWRVT